MGVPARPTVNKHQLRAEEYRAQARRALATAESATLERVREQSQAAAASWAELADAEEARLLALRGRLSVAD